MQWYQVVLAVGVVLTSLIIILLIMLQESKSQGLSGAIAGGAENLFGKSKGRSFEDKLVKYTRVLTVVFFVLTLGTTLLFLFWVR